MYYLTNSSLVSSLRITFDSTVVTDAQLSSLFLTNSDVLVRSSYYILLCNVIGNT